MLSFDVRRTHRQTDRRDCPAYRFTILYLFNLTLFVFLLLYLYLVQAARDTPARLLTKYFIHLDAALLQLLYIFFCVNTMSAVNYQCIHKYIVNYKTNYQLGGTYSTFLDFHFHIFFFFSFSFCFLRFW